VENVGIDKRYMEMSERDRDRKSGTYEIYEKKANDLTMFLWRTQTPDLR